MKNYKQDGRVLTLAAPYALLSGAGALVGSIFGVAQTDAANGADVALVVEGVVELNKTSALAIVVGDKVYWDNAAKEVNKTASGNTAIGYAIKAAANPSPTVEVKLIPLS